MREGLEASANLAAVGPDGTPTIPVNAHVRLASPKARAGVRILRHGFNFVDGTDDPGHLNAGLFFIAFVRDPRTDYVPMQHALSNTDAMAEYLEHTGSALFAIPPGLGQGESWGTRLITGAV